MGDYAKLTVAQLKTELGERGLEKTGTKAELISRLVAADSEAGAKVALEDGDAVVTAETDDIDEELGDEEALEGEEDEAMEQEDEHVDELDEDVALDDLDRDVLDDDVGEEEDLNAEDFVVTEQVGETDGDDGDVKFDDSVEEEGKDDNEKNDDSGQKTTEAGDDEKKKKVTKKWVAIMENEKTAKVLDELKKINKLESLKTRSKEIYIALETHRLRMMPIAPDDLKEAVIIDSLKQGIKSQFKMNASVGDKPELKGMLEITFPKRSILDDQFAKLSLYKESVQVFRDQKDFEWKDQYRQIMDIPVGSDQPRDLDKLRLFAPSLPQSVTEENLWDYFPKAQEILLIDATPRKHAYLTFTSEESMAESVENLNARGPQKEDFKFCRLLRLSEIVKFLPKRPDYRPTRMFQRGPNDARSTRPGMRNTRGFSGPRGNFRMGSRPGPRPVSRTGPSGYSNPARKPMGSPGSSRLPPRTSAPNMSRSRDIHRRRENLQGRRDDHRDRGNSYWGAPRPRSSGLETSFSQLQQPSQMNQQAGLQVLDTLLSTLGQMGNQQIGAMAAAGSGMGRIQDRRQMPGNRNRYEGGGQKRSYSPSGGRGGMNKRPRGSYARGSYNDDRRGNYGQGSSYGGGRGGMYNRDSNYRQSNQGGDRSHHRQDYSMGGSSYRQDSYF